jgi:hypothetical protein
LGCVDHGSVASRQGLECHLGGANETATLRSFVALIVSWGVRGQNKCQPSRRNRLLQTLGILLKIASIAVKLPSFLQRFESGLSKQEPKRMCCSLRLFGLGQRFETAANCSPTVTSPAICSSPPQNPNIRSRIINLKGLLEIFQGKSRRHAAPASPWHAVTDCQSV